MTDTWVQARRGDAAEPDAPSGSRPRPRRRVAVCEMARVTRDRVVIQDNLFLSERVEEAERLRDPSHVRCYTEDEWVGFLEQAGLAVEAVALVRRKLPLEPWIERTIAGPEVADRVRELTADRVDEDGNVLSTAIVLKGRKG